MERQFPSYILKILVFISHIIEFDELGFLPS